MNSNTKMKLLYILRILQDQTDENHKLTVNQIIKQLGEYGIKAERKSIYSDIDLLNEYGFDIICEKGRANKYCMVSREFELTELKLLVDAILAARFITLNKSKDLIKKLEKLVSKFEAKELNRNLIIRNRIKSNNESIYYNVDVINKAINENKKVSFKYFDHAINNEIIYRHNGDRYEVSPYTLMWNDDNYYMVAYHSRYESISNFRVDRMDSIEVEHEERFIENINLPFNEVIYGKKLFYMFSGEPIRVKLEFDKSLMNVIFDRFGHDIKIYENSNQTVIINPEVVLSETFLSWIFMFGDKVKIISPDLAKKMFVNKISKMLALYKYSGPK